MCTLLKENQKNTDRCLGPFSSATRIYKNCAGLPIFYPPSVQYICIKIALGFGRLFLVSDISEQ